MSSYNVKQTFREIMTRENAKIGQNLYVNNEIILDKQTAIYADPNGAIRFKDPNVNGSPISLKQIVDISNTHLFRYFNTNAPDIIPAVPNEQYKLTMRGENLFKLEFINGDNFRNLALDNTGLVIGLHNRETDINTKNAVLTLSTSTGNNRTLYNYKYDVNHSIHNLDYKHGEEILSFNYGNNYNNFHNIYINDNKQDFKIKTLFEQDVSFNGNVNFKNDVTYGTSINFSDQSGTIYVKNNSLFFKDINNQEISLSELSLLSANADTMPGKFAINEFIKYFNYDEINKTFKFTETNNVKYNFDNIYVNDKINLYDNTGLNNHNNNLYLENKNIDISSINTTFNYSVLNLANDVDNDTYTTGFSKHGIHLKNKGVQGILQTFGSNSNLTNGLLTYDQDQSNLLFYDNTTEPSLICGNNYRVDKEGNVKLNGTINFNDDKLDSTNITHNTIWLSTDNNLYFRDSNSNDHSLLKLATMQNNFSVDKYNDDEISIKTNNNIRSIFDKDGNLYVRGDIYANGIKYHTLSDSQKITDLNINNQNHWKYNDFLPLNVTLGYSTKLSNINYNVINITKKLGINAESNTNSFLLRKNSNIDEFEYIINSNIPTRIKYTIDFDDREYNTDGELSTKKEGYIPVLYDYYSKNIINHILNFSKFSIVFNNKHLLYNNENKSEYLSIANIFNAYTVNDNEKFGIATQNNSNYIDFTLDKIFNIDNSGSFYIDLSHNKQSIVEISQFDLNNFGWIIKKEQGTYDFTFKYGNLSESSGENQENKTIKLEVFNKGSNKNIVLINYDMINKSKNYMFELISRSNLYTNYVDNIANMSWLTNNANIKIKLFDATLYKFIYFNTIINENSLMSLTRSEKPNSIRFANNKIVYNNSINTISNLNFNNTIYNIYNENNLRFNHLHTISNNIYNNNYDISNSELEFYDTRFIIVDNSHNKYYSDISHSLQSLNAINKGFFVINENSSLNLDNSGIYIFNFKTETNSEFIYNFDNNNIGWKFSKTNLTKECSLVFYKNDNEILKYTIDITENLGDIQKIGFRYDFTDEINNWDISFITISGENIINIPYTITKNITDIQNYTGTNVVQPEGMILLDFHKDNTRKVTKFNNEYNYFIPKKWHLYGPELKNRSDNYFSENYQWSSDNNNNFTSNNNVKVYNNNTNSFSVLVEPELLILNQSAFLTSNNKYNYVKNVNNGNINYTNTTILNGNMRKNIGSYASNMSGWGLDISFDGIDYYNEFDTLSTDSGTTGGDLYTFREFIRYWNYEIAEYENDEKYQVGMSYYPKHHIVQNDLLSSISKYGDINYYTNAPKYIFPLDDGQITFNNYNKDLQETNNNPSCLWFNYSSKDILNIWGSTNNYGTTKEQNETTHNLSFSFWLSLSNTTLYNSIENLFSNKVIYDDNTSNNLVLFSLGHNVRRYKSETSVNNYKDLDIGHGFMATMGWERLDRINDISSAISDLSGTNDSNTNYNNLTPLNYLHLTYENDKFYFRKDSNSKHYYNLKNGVRSLYVVWGHNIKDASENYIDAWYLLSSSSNLNSLSNGYLNSYPWIDHTDNDKLIKDVSFSEADLGKLVFAFDGSANTNPNYDISLGLFNLSNNSNVITKQDISFLNPIDRQPLIFNPELQIVPEFDNMLYDGIWKNGANPPIDDVVLAITVSRIKDLLPSNKFTSNIIELDKPVSQKDNDNYFYKTIYLSDISGKKLIKKDGTGLLLDNWVHLDIRLEKNIDPNRKDQPDEFGNLDPHYYFKVSLYDYETDISHNRTKNFRINDKNSLMFNTIKNVRIDQILDLTNAINAKGANTDGAMMFIQTPKEGMYNISGIFENITYSEQQTPIHPQPRYNKRLMELVSSVFNIRIFGSSNIQNYNPVLYDKEIFNDDTIIKNINTGKLILMDNNTHFYGIDKYNLDVSNILSSKYNYDNNTNLTSKGYTSLSIGHDYSADVYIKLEKDTLFNYDDSGSIAIYSNIKTDISQNIITNLSNVFDRIGNRIIADGNLEINDSMNVKGGDLIVENGSLILKNDIYQITGINSQTGDFIYKNIMSNFTSPWTVEIFELNEYLNPSKTDISFQTNVNQGLTKFNGSIESGLIIVDDINNIGSSKNLLINTGNNLQIQSSEKIIINANDISSNSNNFSLESSNFDINSDNINLSCVDFNLIQTGNTELNMGNITQNNKKININFRDDLFIDSDVFNLTTTNKASIFNIKKMTTGQQNYAVGINNNNPKYMLDIGGDLNFTGQIYQAGGPLNLSSGGGSGGSGGNASAINNIWEILETHTIDLETGSKNSVNINIERGDYDSYLITFDNLLFENVDNTQNDSLYFRVFDQYVELNTNEYQYSYIESKTDGTTTAYYANSDSSGILGRTVKSHSIINGEIKINNTSGFRNTNGDKYVSYSFKSQNNNGQIFSGYQGSGIVNTDEKLSSLKIGFINNHIKKGKIVVYTLKTSISGSFEDEVWSKLESVAVNKTSTYTQQDLNLDYNFIGPTNKVTLDINQNYKNYLVLLEGVTLQKDNTRSFNTINDISGKTIEFSQNKRGEYGGLIINNKKLTFLDCSNDIPSSFDISKINIGNYHINTGIFTKDIIQPGLSDNILDTSFIQIIVNDTSGIILQNNNIYDELFITCNDQCGNEITNNSYQYIFNEYKTNGNTARYYANEEHDIPIAKSIQAGNLLNGHLYINNKDGSDSSGMMTNFDFDLQTRSNADGNNLFYSYKGGGVVQQTNRLTGLNFKFMTNNIIGGRITIFAIKMAGNTTKWYSGETFGNIYRNGKIGINTDKPTESLDVDGNINFTGNIYNNGNPYKSSGGAGVWEKMEVKEIYNETDVVSLNLDYTYTDYLITFTGVKSNLNSSDNIGSFIFTVTDSTGDLENGEYKYNYTYNKSNGESFTNHAQGENYAKIAKYSVSGDTGAINGEIKLMNTSAYSDTNGYISYDFSSQSIKDSYFIDYQGGGLVNIKNKPLSLNLKYQYAGTKITSGKIIIYALKHNISDEENLWKKIETKTITGVSLSQLSLDINYNYSHYIIQLEGLWPKDSSGELYITGQDISGEITDSSYQYVFNEYKSDGNSYKYYASTESNIPICKKVLTNYPMNGYLYINNKDGLHNNNKKATSFNFSTQTMVNEDDVDNFVGTKGSGILVHNNHLKKLNIQFSGTGNKVKNGRATIFAMKLNGQMDTKWDSSDSQNIYFGGNVTIGEINNDYRDGKLSLISYENDISNTMLSIYSNNNDILKSYTDVKIENGRDNGGLIRAYNEGTNGDSGLELCTICGEGIVNKAMTIHSTGVDVHGILNSDIISSSIYVLHTGGGDVSHNIPLTIGGNLHQPQLIINKPSPSNIHHSGIRIGGYYSTASNSHLFSSSGSIHDAWISSHSGLKINAPRAVDQDASGKFNPYNKHLHLNNISDGEIFIGGGGGNTTVYNVLTAWRFDTDETAYTSDRRIKTEITTVDDDKALNQVNSLECKEYHYKDPLKRNEQKTIGFIAQEVNEIIPNAVRLRTKFVPDELRKIESMSWSNNVLTIPDLDMSIENLTGLCKFYVSDDISGNNEMVKNIECEKDENGKKTNGFEFEKQYTNVFLHSKEVNDFHMIDKNQIFALHHSAIQELSRKNNALQQENVAKNAEIVELKNEINLIKQHLGI